MVHSEPRTVRLLSETLSGACRGASSSAYCSMPDASALAACEDSSVNRLIVPTSSASSCQLPCVRTSLRRLGITGRGRGMLPSEACDGFGVELQNPVGLQP